MRIIVAGGGTGGHITPNIAILEEITKRAPRCEFLYIGSHHGLESELIPAKGWPYRAISCGKLRRYFSWQNFADLFRTLAGLTQSLGIIARYRPDVIFCKGGYVSLPVAVAGGFLRVPVVIHESDLEMGLANKIAARFARIICVSFPETLQRLAGDKRVVLTGNPVRQELLRGNAARGYERCGFRSGKKVILVMGGSQGARSVNELIARNLPRLLVKYQLVHVCGKNNLPEEKSGSREGYFAVEYLGDELADILAMTDLFIGRAGANTLAEIEALGLPALLLPLSAGSRGDQIKNAESFAARHNAVVLTDNDLRQGSFDLSAQIDHILKKTDRPPKREETPAAARIAGIIIKMSGRHDQKN